MIKKNDIPLLTETLDLLDTACHASLEIMNYCGSREAETSLYIVNDLYSVTEVIRRTYTLLKDQLEESNAFEMLENIVDTLNKVQCFIKEGLWDKSIMKAEYQLFPFLRQLREILYFYGMVYPDKQKMEQYYKNEFAVNYRNLYINDDESPEYRLSIFVCGYNHLDVTRRCVEHLLKETDFEALNAELILIDHGSTDDTLEYFESLGLGRVVHFKHNVRMNVFVTVAQLCKGKYFCFISNDVLVTRDWANILLKCLESDERIIAVVPTTPNIANLQMLNPPTNDPDEFIAWAGKQNKSDCSRWNDRARLMPPIAMYRSSAVNKIGFADPYFTTMEFWDDDFSVRARRAGYRQLVCDDVACYHFGSVTGREFQKSERTLEEGRTLFKNKYGIDAWGNGFCYNYYGVDILMKALPSNPNSNVLFLDSGMGDDSFQLQNLLRHNHKSASIYQMTSQKKYLPDLKPQFKNTVYSPCLYEGLLTEFSGRAFSCIYINRDISNYEEISELLDSAVQRLDDNGCLIFRCENPFYAQTIAGIMNGSLTKMRYTFSNPEQVREEVNNHFSNVSMMRLEQPINGVHEFIKRYFGQVTEQRIQMMNTKVYYFMCRK